MSRPRLRSLSSALQSLDLRTATPLQTNTSFNDPNRAGTTARGCGWDWQQRRERILKRDGYQCQACKARGLLTAANQVDHIVPKADGGSDDDSSLQSMCKPWHDAKTAAENATRLALPCAPHCGRVGGRAILQPLLLLTARPSHSKSFFTSKSSFAETKMARPAFKPTTAQRRRVSIAAACGLAHETIALALGITRPTLLRHFKAELSSGAALRKLEVVEVLHQRVRAGSVAAIRLWLAIEAREARPVQPGAPAPRPPRLGKKEAARLAAKTAAEGTEWEGILPATTTVQ